MPAYKSTYLVGIAKICVILAINRHILLLLLPRYVNCGTYIHKYSETFIFPAYKSTYLVGIAKICVILAINRPFLLLLLPRYVTGTYIGKYKFSFHRSENTNLNRESCPPCMEFEGTFENIFTNSTFIFPAYSKNIFTNSTFIFPAYQSTYLVGIAKICVILAINRHILLDLCGVQFYGHRFAVLNKNIIIILLY